mgnify:CR=1 FL=1
MEEQAEVVEVTEVTDDMIAAYQQRKAQAEQQARHQLLNDLAAMAQERGYTIIAAPQILDDGRIGAAWGVQRLDR